MQLTIKSVTNPFWSNAEKSRIDCTVVFAELGEEAVPFTATPDDTMAHGCEIFNRCVAGDFGPVADYIPPSDEEVARVVRLQRNSMLSASDWTQLPDVPQATKTLWAAYRQALRGVTDQSGFPQNVTWPTPPQ